MKAPSLTDRAVRVTAYLTDEVFGYEHWRAAQFSAPRVASCRPAVLVLCSDDAEAERLRAHFSELPVPPGAAQPRREA